MTDLPYTYTYTDVDGDRLAVFGADIPRQGKGVNVRTDRAGCSFPTEDAPALARAILDAAGDTGHLVVSAEENDAVRALPLLPDGADTTPVYESPQELAEEIDRLRTVVEDGDNERIARLEAENRELHAAQEHQGRELSALRVDMCGAQAAIRGVGKDLQEHAEAHLTYATDVERRLERLERQARPIVLHTPESDH